MILLRDYLAYIPADNSAAKLIRSQLDGMTKVDVFLAFDALKQSPGGASALSRFTKTLNKKDRKIMQGIANFLLIKVYGGVGDAINAGLQSIANFVIWIAP